MMIYIHDITIQALSNKAISWFDIITFSVQLVGMVTLIIYTVETFKIRKQDSKSYKSSQERYLNSIKPIISVKSIEANKFNPVGIISTNNFVITNIGTGVAQKIEIFVKFNDTLWDKFNIGFPYILPSESRKVDRLTSYTLDHIKKTIQDSYGNEAEKIITKSSLLANYGDAKTRSIFIIYKDITENIFYTQMDIIMDATGQRSMENGKEIFKKLD